MMVEVTMTRLVDEERIVTLLDTLHALPEKSDGARQRIEKEILELVDRHFREVLKPFLLSRFGAVAGEGGAARYTAMMNDFFTKVLNHRLDEFWRAKSAATLRKWASVVVSNQIRDYLRREKHFEEGFDIIAPLVEERRDFFQEKTDRRLTTRALDEIDSWCDSNAEVEQVQGWVLRHRFVDGMTRDQIADQLNVGVHTVRKALDAGIAALRVVLDE
jgi:RNA polymerase sigma factor (sigma-70 family)